MERQFVVIWFRHLKTDWMIRHQTHLKDLPFALALADHGHMKITEVSAVAKAKGIYAGMIVADARVILPEIKIYNDNPSLADKLLRKLALWCIRYTPLCTVDSQDGLILDVSGCTHLWGSDVMYLKNILNKLISLGYHVRGAMAGTIGAAWAVCRYGKSKAIIKSGEHFEALLPLPSIALRLESDIVERLNKLGLYEISSFINMQRSALRRRFGEQLLLRIDQALGNKEEIIQPVMPVNTYSERLPCLDPVQTAIAIEIALQKLLETLCERLKQEGKGLRRALLKCYRTDDKAEQIVINTNHPSNNSSHLFKLFEIKISTIEPAPGIELFVLEAFNVENIIILQQTFWTANSSLENNEIAELLDRLENKFGNDIVHRYLPDEHHLPERSIKLAGSLKDPAIEWSNDKLRPIQLLNKPQPIQVTVPVPDYPPMNFRFNGRLHKVAKADACERIEPEWWLEGGLHRDYYIVEDEEGGRYWIFRSGHPEANKIQSWFIHGFFA